VTGGTSRDQGIGTRDQGLACQGLDHGLGLAGNHGEVSAGGAIRTAFVTWSLRNPEEIEVEVLNRGRKRQQVRAVLQFPYPC